MFQPDQYELIDFGEGRKLERFGPWVLDRPSPAAEGEKKALASAWDHAHARYHRTAENRGSWQILGEAPPAWTIARGEIRLELKRTEFGHVGVFPEQAENWDWIARQVQTAQTPVKVLNLFAYTGGSTLAAAAAGAEVVHVDSARNTVAWARRNAERSGLGQKPIRWIAEDAAKFVRRELKRGSQYNAVILDPPSYGHGPKGEAWQLADDLPPLLEQCAQLTAGRPRFMLLTCHSPGFGPAELSRLVSEALGGQSQATVAARELALCSSTGRRLPSGVAAWAVGREEGEVRRK
ncbi:MAG: class I SAM-dependent methyltransferase [Pirellulales bacterium]